MDNKRLFLAALLSLGVLVLWQFLFPPPKPLAPTTAPIAVTAPAPAAPAPDASAPTSASPSTAPAAAPLVEVPSESAQAETRITLEGNGFHTEWSNRGAELVSFQLTGYEEHGGGTVELVRPRQGVPYPFGLTKQDGSPSALNQALFVATQREDGAIKEAAFRYAAGGMTAEKIFRLHPDGVLEISVRATGEPGWGVYLGPGLRRLAGEAAKSRFEQRAAVYRAADKVEFVPAQRADAPFEVAGAGLQWIGLEDTYFLTVLSPKTPLTRAVFRPQMLTGENGAAGFEPLPAKDVRTKEQRNLPRELDVVIYPAGDRFSAQAYFGSKQYQRLAALGWGLERTVRWGSFGILAKPLLLSLQWIHQHVVANYGWAIILLTLLIKLVTLPLTHKSYVSMRKMQELNPKMQAIRERWRPKLKDRQGRANLEAQRKMNEEITGLFKAEGVNPAGGCLPMLLQLPILWAFYNLLSTAIELRGAPWFGWIHDLSVADPYYVLPIVMGATQVIQQRMTPQTGDAMQRRMFQLMPIVFTIMFLGFPAGMVLYWLVNNVLTIAQQGIYNHLKSRQAAAGGQGA